MGRLSESSDGEETRWHATYSLGKIDSGNPTTIAALVQLLESSEDENTLCQVAESLGKIDPGNQTATMALVQLLKLTEDDSIRGRVAESLKKILRDEQLTGVVTSLKNYLSDETHKNDFGRFYQCYEVIWHCAQIITYPGFYQAWHNQLTLTRSLNLAELPQTLSVVIANNFTFSQTIHLICIDGSKFIDRDNPAAKIYTEMVRSGCPKCEDGTPKTMQELQAYWDLLDTDKRVVLVFYQDKGFSEMFLDALSKFDGAICVITAQPIDNIPLQCFRQNQAIADVIEWLKQIAQCDR